MAPATADVPTHPSSTDGSETLIHSTRAFRSDNTHYKKRISLSYIRRAEQNPNRMRKDGTAIYNHPFDLAAHNLFAKDVIKSQCAFKNAPLSNTRKNRIVRKNAEFEVLEETSLAYNMAVELPYDRLRKQSVLEAIKGLHVHSEHTMAKLTAALPTENDHVTVAALHDLCLENDTSMERGAEFNFNYLVPAGPEFIVKQSKPRKNGKARGKQALAKNNKASKSGFAVASNEEATTISSATSKALPFDIFKWGTWLAAATGVGAMVSSASHKPEVSSNSEKGDEEEEEDWDILSISHLEDDEGQAESKSADTNNARPSPWVVLESGV
ncbi:hypothetical protein Cpir12675_003361 [Ceratocystis pirilliformis]|uniref:Uncharacterized protein n=1 Tax=Ceratocystis pirilliformis TaxID=259994 RepID=A0ABR3Z4I5_9PEZI